MEGLSPQPLKPLAPSPCFATGLWLSMVLGSLLLAGSFFWGKENLFLLLNGNGGPMADAFFQWATYLGDGVIWVPIGLLTLWKARSQWVLVFATILLSTAWVNVGKRVIYPNELRPTAVIAEQQAIHVVKGVELHTQNSFPSGHTTTAFSVFLLALCFWDTVGVLLLGFVLALCAAYSRVYLAQHFPLDLGGGMWGAGLSVLGARYLQGLWASRQKKP